MDCACAKFRFFGELNDFLPVDQRGASIRYPLDGTVAIKHSIESLGVPHPEVGLILVNGRSVGFTYTVRAGDEAYIYPWDGGLTNGGTGQLRAALARPVRFVLDTHLGRLAAYLRMFGYDTLYRNDFDDATLADISASEQRILLTRDRGLLKRKVVVYGHCVRRMEPRAQLIDVLLRYDLLNDVQPWRRCLRCNGMLGPVAKSEILDLLEPKTKLYYDVFQRCEDCEQIYWQGSHRERMQAFVEGVLAECGRLRSP